MSATVPRDLGAFAASHDGVVAVLQRVGRDTWDLVLVDESGNWNRAVFDSDARARAAAEGLGLPVVDGWDEQTARRMNLRDHWGEPGGQRRAL